MIFQKAFILKGMSPEVSSSPIELIWDRLQNYSDLEKARSFILLTLFSFSEKAIEHPTSES